MADDLNPWDVSGLFPDPDMPDDVAEAYAELARRRDAGHAPGCFCGRCGNVRCEDLRRVVLDYPGGWELLEELWSTER